MRNLIFLAPDLTLTVMFIENENEDDCAMAQFEIGSGLQPEILLEESFNPQNHHPLDLEQLEADTLNGTNPMNDSFANSIYISAKLSNRRK